MGASLFGRILGLSCFFALGVSACGGGTSGNPPDLHCGAYCTDMCSTLGDCNIGSSSAQCNHDCNEQNRGRDCRDYTPASQYTCDELGDAYRCAQYCSVFCQRIPECGAFDGQLCEQGCATITPPICNASSVGARTCDQLKPEARFYDDAGRALQGGAGDVAGFISPASVGLCESTNDCAAGLACDIATNTCDACASNDDCKRTDSRHYLCTSGQCLKVDCIADSDCFAKVCSTSNTCVDCRDDGDCADNLLGTACDTQASSCVECLTDAHCAASITSNIYPACDTQARKCVECTRDEHCADNTVTNELRCRVDAERCVECLTDSDCSPTSLSPHCNTQTGFCSAG